jgi:WD40 repeat protein/predicted Ser/Thr protein kinase
VQTHPELETPLREFFRDRDGFDRLAPHLAPTATQVGGPAAPPELAPGSQFGGYDIVRELGRGGMGVVYLARQRQANRLVALKLIRTDRLAHLTEKERQEWLARFRTEGQAAARVTDERVVTVYVVGTLGDRPFYSMRYVEGRSLAENLKAGPLTNRSAATLMEQVARAVQAVHEQGVLHRDLKPHNILVDVRGRPFVTDFGLAKWAEAADSLTDPGALLGSPQYVSPEQAQDSARVTRATDVYGLGATLYALLTGRPPFDGTTVIEILHQVMYRAPVPPRRLNPAVDRDLDTVVLKCLEKEPGRRFDSAAEVADELQRYLQGRPLRTRPVGPAGRLWRWGRRNPVLAPLAAAAVLLLGVAGMLSWAYSSASDSADKAGQEATVARQGFVQAKEEAAQSEDRAARADKEALKNKGRANREWYAGQMHKLRDAHAANDMARVRELLEELVPQEAGATDYRGFEWYYWHRLCHRELLTLKTPPGVDQSTATQSAVRHVAFSADGRRLAAAVGGQVRVWDADGGKEVFTHKGGALSPDGRWLATGELGDIVRIRDADGGREVHSLGGDLRGKMGGLAGRVAFSPDGKRLVSCASFLFDATVRVWDVETGRRVLNRQWHSRGLLRGITGEPGRPAFSPDGKRLAWADWDTTVRVWDLTADKELIILKGHDEPKRGTPADAAVWGVAFSPDGGRLASAGADGFVRVWDLATGKELHLLSGHQGAALGVAFSPDGKRVAAAGKDTTVRTWNAENGHVLDKFQGHTGPVWDVAFSPDGRRLASVSDDGTVRVWDARTDPGPLVLKGHKDWGRGGWVGCVAFSPDGKRLASAGNDTVVRLWDLSGGRELLALPGSRFPILGVAFSPDGTRLLSAGEEPSIVRVRDASTGKELDNFRGPIGPWQNVAFSPDGRRLAWAHFDMQVHVFDLSTRKELFALGGHGGPVGCVAFSPDGTRLASAAMDDPTVRVWDGSDGKLLHRLKGHTTRRPDARPPDTHFDLPRQVWGLAFSADGRLASAGADGTVRVWDVAVGKELLTLKGHSGRVAGVAYSPDGRRLASAGADETVRVWDAVSGHELLVLKGHASTVRAVAFSPDGRRLASAGADGTVRVW